MGHLSNPSYVRKQYETLAVGGRYDNVIAHYHPVDVPVAVGVRFFCNRLIKKIHYHEKQRRRDPQNQAPVHFSVDVYIVSQGDMTQDKMELLAELWRSNIRSEADYSNDFEQNPNSVPRARFLITFKKVIKKASNTDTKMIKVLDNELKLQREETRETVVEYIKSRLNKQSGYTHLQ